MYVWGFPGLRFRDIYGCIRAYGSEFAYPIIVRGGSKSRHTFCGGQIKKIIPGVQAFVFFALQGSDKIRTMVKSRAA